MLMMLVEPQRARCVDQKHSIIDYTLHARIMHSAGTHQIHQTLSPQACRLGLGKRLAVVVDDEIQLLYNLYVHFKRLRPGPFN